MDDVCNKFSRLPFFLRTQNTNLTRQPKTEMAAEALRKKRVISNEDDNMEDATSNSPLFMEMTTSEAMADEANSADKPHENGEITKIKSEEDEEEDSKDDNLWEVESITQHKGRKVRTTIKSWILGISGCSFVPRFL